jgi:hypothetical protein
MNDQPPLPGAKLDACSTGKGNPLEEEKIPKSGGRWWFAAILTPVLGVFLGMLAFLCNERNIIDLHEEFDGLEFIIYPVIGFAGSSLLSAAFLVISLMKKERHSGKAMLISLIYLLLNIFLFFG